MSGDIHDPLAAAEELIRITATLSMERDIDRLLDMVVSAACRISRADRGLIYVLDSTKRNLNIQANYNGSVKANISEFESIPLFINEERNLARLSAYTAFSGKLINIANIYEYTGFGFEDIYAFDRKYKYKTRSVLSIPLHSHKNETVGILQLFNRLSDKTQHTEAFPPEIEPVVAAFASQAAVAIDNTKLIAKNKQLIDVLNNTNRKLEEENIELRKKIQTKYDFTRIVGQGPAMQNVFSLMKKIFNSDATVLLGGQTGTGKELIAQTIHYNSSRGKKEFVAQNCAALPENLLESELFGFKKGAFSGANADKKGLIELADGGTLFLDEIGDMPLTLQAKLLRVLQEKEVRPLGSLTAKKVDVRVVAATHCDLMQKIEAGEFREDLYYRLSVFPIMLPPLIERREDIPPLLQYFLNMFSKQYNKNVSGFSPAALDLLLRYNYPGNIRELRNIIERAVLLCEDNGSILEEHLPECLLDISSPSEISNSGQDMGDLLPNYVVSPKQGLKDVLESFEATVVRKKLSECQWNQTQAAEALKIGRRTLIEKMKRYKIKRKTDSIH